MTTPNAITLALEILREDMRAMVECHAHPDTGVIPPDEPEAREAFDRYCAAINGLEALPDTLTSRLQQQCTDWGTYWRAPDAHGVELTPEQALQLLRTALGVEVEIKTPASRQCKLIECLGRPRCAVCVAIKKDAAMGGQKEQG